MRAVQTNAFLAEDANMGADLTDNSSTSGRSAKPDFLAWPPVNRTLDSLASEADTAIRARTGGIRCTTRLVRTGVCYWRTLAMVPSGCRISGLEEVGYLISAQRRR